MSMFKEIITGCIIMTIVLLSSCNDGNDQQIVFQEDFFCDEDKPAVFFSFQIDGEDIFISNGTTIDLDMCNLSNEISSNEHFYLVREEDFLFYGTRINMVSRGYDISFDLLGSFFANDPNFDSERAIADAILQNDFQYLKVGGSGEYLNENMEQEIPSIRPSFVNIEFRAKFEDQTISYVTGAPFVSSEFPFNLVGFQQGSSLEIDDIEEIDYVNPDFPEITYNYIISGSFECRLYRERSAEKFLDVVNGRFRLPIRIESPSGLL